MKGLTIMNILIKILLIIFAMFSIVLLIKSWYIVKNIPSAILFYRKNKENDEKFPFYGIHYYCGRQGSGKTFSMTHELEQIRKKYPKVKIYTNYGYKYQNLPIYNISMLTDEKYYNGSDGVVFAIDEIQNLFQASNINNVPPEILGVVTQLRKQKVYIICTSQVFTRVSKPLREQAFYITECKTLLHSLTVCNKFNADEYLLDIDRVEKKSIPIERYSIVHTDELRNCYDTFQLIKSIK